MATKREFCENVGNALKLATPPTTPKQATNSTTSAQPSTLLSTPANDICLPALGTNTKADGVPTGKVVVFDTAVKKFQYHTLATSESPISFISESQGKRKHVTKIPILKFTSMIDLGLAGVKIEEAVKPGDLGMGSVYKKLPSKVVWLRLLGSYKELYVVRNAKDVEGEGTVALEHAEGANGRQEEEVVKGQEAMTGTKRGNDLDSMKHSENVKRWDTGAREFAS